MAPAGKGVSRVLSKLKCSVEEGRYYEAHQMYRTLYFRCVGRRLRRGSVGPGVGGAVDRCVGWH